VGDIGFRSVGVKDDITGEVILLMPGKMVAYLAGA
jgi:hypothetical protein